jgi:hypothetical protein
VSGSISCGRLGWLVYCKAACFVTCSVTPVAGLPSRAGGQRCDSGGGAAVSVDEFGNRACWIAVAAPPGFVISKGS